MSDHGGGWWSKLKRAIGLAPRHVEPTPEQHKQIARRALAQGDLPHCAHTPARPF